MGHHMGLRVVASACALFFTSLYARYLASHEHDA